MAEDKTKSVAPDAILSWMLTPVSAPPILFLALLAGIGYPVSSWSGGTAGASAAQVQVAADLEKLEKKVDKLASKNEELHQAVIELKIAVIRVHVNDKGFGGTP